MKPGKSPSVRPLSIWSSWIKRSAESLVPSKSPLKWPPGWFFRCYPLGNNEALLKMAIYHIYGWFTLIYPPVSNMAGWNIHDFTLFSSVIFAQKTSKSPWGISQPWSWWSLTQEPETHRHGPLVNNLTWRLWMPMGWKDPPCYLENSRTFDWARFNSYVSYVKLPEVSWCPILGQSCRMNRFLVTTDNTAFENSCCWRNTYV